MVKLLAYLEHEFGKTVANEFLRKVDKRINTLSDYPFIGKSVNQPETLRSILITKYNRMYYRITGNVIEIINLYDTRINPKKNPYNKK